MDTDNQSKKRAVAYSVLAHIKENHSAIDGPLVIFIPLAKNCISKLYPNGTAKGANISEITNKIYEEFALDIPIPVMRLLLVQIAKEVNKSNGREDIILYGDDSFCINAYSFEDYSDLIQNGKTDVEEIQRVFKEFCKIYHVEDNHGSNSIFSFIEQNQYDISYYLAHAEKTTSGDCTLAAQFIDTFQKTPRIFDKLRDLYLGSILTSYVLYQPSEVKMDIELLLDTNFIVSLLDLNTKESTKTCNTLIESCRKLGYKFTVLNDTVEEIQSLLAFKGSTLSTAIIAKNINKEDIYNACERRGLNSADLDRISDNLGDTLTKGFGFYIIPHTEKWSNLAKFGSEYSKLKKVRSNDKAALHDAMALEYVREKRGGKKIRDFEKVKCWFVNNSINHENDNVLEDFIGTEEYKSYQPEIIKVDDLLNILWLSNPNIDISNSDLVDIGLTSLISFTLSSSLPKSRVIKELDDNIQKYRDAQDISDMDVLRLSTRIANRQIADIQSLNELAKKDSDAFASKVKEEAQKQKTQEEEQAKRIEEMVGLVNQTIQDLRNNRDKQQQKHQEKLDELNNEHKRLLEKEKQFNDQLEEFRTIQYGLLEKNKELLTNSEAIEKESDEREQLIIKLFNKENEKRNQEYNRYVDLQIKKWQNKTKIAPLVLSIILLMAITFSIILFCSSNVGWVNEVNRFLSFKPISFIIPIVIGIIDVFTFKHCYNCCTNPNYINDKRSHIVVPTEYKRLTLEEFKKK